MKNLINFFFSFDKLFKEKLVIPFFWLALIVWALSYSATALDSIELDPLAALIEFVGFFAELLLVLVSIRIISEIFVAIFRINDNLSPDGGKSELADIDPIAETRRAAEMAASRTREVTKSATEKTRSTLDDVKHSVEDTAENLTSRARSLTGTAKPQPKVIDRDESALGVGSTPKPEDEPTPVKALEPSAIDKATVQKRGRGRPKGSKNKATPASAATIAAKRGPGRPKGSKNKSTTKTAATPKAAATAKTATATKASSAPAKRGRGRPKGSKNKPKPVGASTGSAPKRGPGRPKGSKNKASASGSKPGPKKGQPIPRDADGNLLKKDGTPRKKPGPKSKD